MVVCFRWILNGFGGQFQNDRVKWCFGAVGPFLNVEYFRPRRRVGIAPQPFDGSRSGGNEVPNRRHNSHLKLIQEYT